MESDESMIMKCNTVTRDGLCYTKFVTRSIALIQLTKRYLKTTAIVQKIRERILQRIRFELRKNNSNFYVSTVCGPFEGGLPGQVSLMLSSLIRHCWDSLVTFCS